MSLAALGSSVREAFEERIRPLVARHRRLALAVVSLAAGALYTARILGARVLNPLDVGWLRGDALTEYLGWTFMRQDPVTALPLTFTDRVGYPLTISAAHFDLAPGVAVALLPLSRILPSEFQYIGCFRSFCAAALFYVGHELARFFGKSEVMALAAGTLLMTNSVFTHRLGIHTALTAQFFLVLIIYEAMKRLGSGCDRAMVRAGMLRVVGLAVAALGTNPYIALMSMILASGYVVAAVLSDRALARFAALLALGGGLASGAAAWFFGYYSPIEDISAPGLGAYSANLNTLVNPIVFSRFFGGMAVFGPEQMEGSAYLGVGVGAVLAIALASAFRSSAFRGRLRPLAPMLCAAGLAFVVSLSHRVTLGSRVVAEIPLSTPVRNFLSMFRASGRLSWPLFYLLVALAVASIGLLVPRRAQGIVMTVVAIIQLVEFTPLATGVRIAAAAWGPPVELRSEAFRRLNQAHRHLVILPAWQCSPELSPGGIMGYGTFGLLAARERMTINSYYSSRYSNRVVNFHCRTLPTELLNSGPKPDTAYVVDSKFLAWFEANATKSHECGVRDGFGLCVRRGTLY